ncbi:MAG: hypothetical protein ABI581_02185 [Sediminibacterium sp.]
MKEILLSYLLLFIVVCGVNCTNDFKKNHHTAVNRFKEIDAKLNEAAKKLNTEISTDKGGYTIDNTRVPDDKIEARSIFWIDGEIGKGITIRPHFEKGNFDSPSWDFSNIAWLYHGESNADGRPFWTRDLLKKTDFATIEKNIDQLLIKSVETLKAIKREDLKNN